MNETEESIDLTPGVVWTDAQLAVVRDLTARAVRAEAAVNRVEAVMAAWDRGQPVGGYLPREIRRALDGTT